MTMVAPPDVQAGGIDLAVEVLDRIGRLRLRVTGTSMLPALLPGDVVALERCAAGELFAGDMVLFRRGPRLVLHRLLAPAAGGWRTQGDGLSRPDLPVAASEILGRVTGVERNERRLPARHRSGWRLRVGRVLFGRSVLAVRMFLRWQRTRARLAA